MKIYLFLVAFFCFSSLFGQTKLITGQVTDQQNGAPMSGVTVLVKGTKVGTTTDVNGKFSINAPADGTLVISFIGYAAQEVAINNRTSIDVSLNPENQSLNEVVVIGYGQQKRVNVIGSVSTVSSKEITQAPVSSVSNALAGRLPGAIIQQYSGEPGNDAASILIRGSGTLGNTSPLVVVDGIPDRDLNAINPNDIESISILKDASAAIYGARAANGVILVTTKHGKEGAPPRLTYSFYQGLLSPTSLPKMADAATYAQMLLEMETYKGIAPANLTYTPEDVAKFKSGKYPWTYPNTNWWDATLKKYSQTRHQDFSISGGSKAVDYYASFGTQFDDGLYKNSSKAFHRYNFRANLDVRVNKYLTLGLNLSGSHDNLMEPSLEADSYHGLLFNVVNQNKPTTVATWPNGLPGPGAFGPSYQPQLRATAAGGFDQTKRYRSDNKIRAKFDIPGIDGLSVNSYFAYDVFFDKRKVFDQAVTAYTLDEGAYYAAGNDGSQDGSAFLVPISDNYDPQLTDYYDDKTEKVFNISLNYDKTFNDVHHLSAFVAHESSETNGNGISAFRRYFISTQLPYLFAGGNDQKDNSEYVNLDSRINYFGRISYNYKEKYFLQFAFRRDGSLRFSKESGRWGNFPSVLGGWIASNEDFWKEHVKFVDFFKLKASWGQLGNDLVPPFQYLTAYAFGTGGVYGSNAVYSSSLVQSNVPNPNITWEVSNQYNVGFESRMLSSKITFNADFFYQRRSNILVKRNASVPNFTGLALPDENFGIVDNKGMELELGYNSRSHSDFSYSISGNFSYAHNKIVEFDEPATSVPWQRLTGHPMGARLLYKAIGIFRDTAQINKTPHVPGAIPGDVIIEDYNGDGKITTDDQIIFDKTITPEITYGISLNLHYKNFDLNALVYGVAHAMVKRLGSQQGTAGDYYQYNADGRWTPDNINASKPRAYDGSKTYWRGKYLVDEEFQNQSYARLKNVQLSYTFPRRWINTVYMKDAQIYVSGENLFLIYAAKDRIWDPEFSGGVDNYPIMRVISVGARVSF
ncbi:MAG: SusC/RagA family TonB-linked outer membrane protein [Ginsengibacter sp.]